MCSASRHVIKQLDLVRYHPMFSETVLLCTLTFAATASSISCVTTVLPQYFRDKHIFEYRVNPTYMNACSVNMTRNFCHDTAPLWAKTYNLEEFKNGVIFALSAFVTVAMQPALANAIHRYGSRFITLITFPSMLLGTVMMCMLKSYPGLCVARIVQSGGIQITSLMTQVDETYKYEPAYKHAAVSIVLGGWAVGTYIMPAVTGSLYHIGGKTLAFAILVVIQVVLQFCWLIDYVIHRRQQLKVNASEKLPIIIVSAETSNRAEGAPRQLSYWTLIHNRHHIAAELSIVVVFSGSAFIAPQLSNMMHNIDETLTQGEIGRLYWTAFLGYLMGTVLGPLLVARWPHRRWMIMNASAVLMIAGCLVIAFVKTYAQMSVALLLLACGQALVLPIAITLAVDITNQMPGGEHSAPRVLTMTNFSFYVGFVLGGLVGGMLAQYTSMQVAALTFVGFNSVILLYCVCVSKTCTTCTRMII